MTLSSYLKILLPIALLVVLLDDIALWWWKREHPGMYMYSVINQKDPTVSWMAASTDFPNGHRPAGGY